MSDAERPNVLLVTTDEQRYDTLGATGNDAIRTPNIDALADRGALFERAYIQNPVCIPSRACLQTGRYTHQHGVTYMESEINETPGLPDWELTFMERLQAAGYRTGGTGKLHMMPHKGLDYERLCGGKGARWRRTEDPEYGPAPLGPTYASWLEKRHPGGYEAIYEQRRRSEYQEYKTAVTNVLPAEEYVDHWIAEEAIEFLHDPGDRPFFLWCGFCSPHPPIDPPEPYDSLYDPEDVPLPKRRDEDDPSSPKGASSPEERLWEDEEVIRRWRAYYWGLVTFIDDQIGRLVETLEARGLMENTLIAFVSDHGAMAGDYHRMAKGNFYEEVTRVPLVVVPPGGADVDSVEGLVEISDLAPTVLDYAGVEVPDVMPTRSLRPLLEGDGEPRESVLCEHLSNDRTRRGKCVRTDRYKYVFNDSREDEFYDLREDPNELDNRIDDADYAEEVSEHRRLLLDRLAASEQSYFTDETPSDRELKSWLK